MIGAIKDIGEYVLEREGRNVDKPLDILIQNPAHKKTYKHILTVELEKLGYNEFSFQRVALEPYGRKKEKKVLYRSGPSNGTDYSPTVKITDKNKIGEKFNNRIIKWFKDNEGNIENFLDEEEIVFFNNLYSCLLKNQSEIISQLEEKTKEFSPKDTGIITLVFIEDDERKYLNKFSLFEKIMIKNYYISLKWSKTYKVYSQSNNKVCSVCKEQSEVYGLVSTFQFYNVDKPGFISGGFNRSNSWKNYPVCLNCALKLEEGKKYLENNLKFHFHKFEYYLIPKPILKENFSEIIEILEEDFGGHQKKRKVGMGQKFINTVQEGEEDILDLELLSRKENFLNYNFMFFDTEGKPKSVFKILLIIEDILPSRLKKLFDAKESVDSKHIFKNFENFGHKKPLKFTFGNVWRFYPKISSGENKIDLSKYFLEITNRIFTNKKVDYQFLLRDIMRKIRKEFIKWDSGKLFNPTKESTYVAFQLLDYLNELKLLKNFNGGKYMSEDKIFGGVKTDLDDKIDAFFSEFPDFYNTDAKRAIFLEGVLTQLLLNIQYNERESTPFRTKLQGLNLDEKLVKALLPKIQNKLEEYDKNYYKNLESKISEYMTKSGNNWKMTKDEISFYFVLGMNLSNFFKSNKEVN